MRIAILGAGLMGPAVAFNALSDPLVTGVTLCDLDVGQLHRATEKLAGFPGSEKLETTPLDLTDGETATKLLAGFDVAVAALSQQMSPLSIRAATAAGTPMVDLIQPPLEEIAGLAAEVENKGNLVVFGCGVDPGLGEVMARFAAGRLERVFELHILCGGVPERPSPPLGYKILFGGRSLPLRTEDGWVVEGGELRRVPRYSGVESVCFEGIGEMEGYHEGFPPGLLDLPEMKGLRSGTVKTLRWPGYAARAAMLLELGMLGNDPVKVNGAEVVPKRFLDALLAPRVRMGERERDLTLLRVETSGEIGGRPARCRVETVDRYDPETGFSSMARITGFTAAIVARMIGRGEIGERGLLSPERVVTGEKFERLVGELAAAGIRFEVTGERTEVLTGKVS